MTVRWLLHLVAVVLLAVLSAWAGGILHFGEGINVPVTLAPLAGACWLASCLPNPKPKKGP